MAPRVLFDDCLEDFFDEVQSNVRGLAVARERTAFGKLLWNGAHDAEYLLAEIRDGLAEPDESVGRNDDAAVLEAVKIHATTSTSHAGDTSLMRGLVTV